MVSFTNVAVNRNNILGTRRTSGSVCIGNLVKNGRFEKGLTGWHHQNTRIVSGKETHEGRGAAGLGAHRHNLKSAWVFQCIPLPPVSYPLYLQLFFSVAGFRNAPANLEVTLSWFDPNVELLEHGIRAYIQKRAIGDGSKGQWNTYTFISEQVPQDADFAVIRFCKRPGSQRGNFLIVDDIILTPIMSSCFNTEENPCDSLSHIVEDILPRCDFKGPTSE